MDHLVTPRRIAVVTVGRSDYGILRPVLRAVAAHPAFHLSLIAAGMHLRPEFGDTLGEIAADGFNVDERVSFALEADSPAAIARAGGSATIGFADAYASRDPNLLVLLGDRFETHAAASAAVPFGIPIAHIHGGELTEGAIDEQYRHAITKLSHLHFVANQECAQRVIQMGEEPWRVVVSGAPGLDNVRDLNLETVADVAARHGIDVKEPFVLVTYHPGTAAWTENASHVTELIAALATVDDDVIVTAPTGDPGHRLIREALEQFVRSRPRAWLVPSLGTRDYFSLMARAAAVVGNSSSGIIEAASFAAPVVNIGDRQRGRMRPSNVIDVGYSRDEIAAGIARATSVAFRSELTGLVNPYGDGHAAARIVETLAATAVDQRLLRKRFHVV